ncbi:hypothetical protein OB2597_19211 [Pseudooceanicola batsensis HTCC2597]|uniref:DUF11 domain-containing protein n=1 Tax=Pseudooceanicola batsensis (strain ATCC BAA-863 / DSM 15984 / KCTC 12145 / HTCC2597) TaxID=252305 RepID=A3U0F2_PSEBH|nr:hypothetical protein [Pseudooceanicola batsensis]EAQ02243.1 hypothetical protein OB2597_19211 [Pseudooceanicola batsensis HTCC2597]
MFNYLPRITRIIPAVIASSLLGAAAQADALTSNFSYRIVQPAADGGEELIERSSVRPGEVIQYRIRHENVSDEGLSGIVVMARVPQGASMTFGAQSTSVPAVFEVQAEMDPEQDGLEWSSLPAMRRVAGADGRMTQEPLPESEVTAVRWVLTEPLPAGESALNTYRVRVN